MTARRSLPSCSLLVAVAPVTHSKLASLSVGGLPRWFMLVLQKQTPDRGSGLAVVKSSWLLLDQLQLLWCVLLAKTPQIFVVVDAGADACQGARRDGAAVG